MTVFLIVMYGNFISILLIFAGIYCISIGCISEIEETCFSVKPIRGILNNFIYKQNDIYYDLYGKFISNNNTVCIILIDNLLKDKNEEIISYNKFHIDKKYEILIKSNGKCLLENNESYSSCTYVGLIVLLFGLSLLCIMIYSCFCEKRIKIMNIYYLENINGNNIRESIIEEESTTHSTADTDCVTIDDSHV